MKIIKFKVMGQHIECVEPISDLVGNTKEYVEAHFELSEEWNGLIQIAVFEANSKPYPVVLQNGVCEIPAEVMRQEVFWVGVYAGAGTERVTSDTCKVRVNDSVGYQCPMDYVSIYEKMAKENEELRQALEQKENEFLEKLKSKLEQTMYEHCENDMYSQDGAHNMRVHSGLVQYNDGSGWKSTTNRIYGEYADDLWLELVLQKNSDKKVMSKSKKIAAAGQNTEIIYWTARQNRPFPTMEPFYVLAQCGSETQIVKYQFLAGAYDSAEGEVVYATPRVEEEILLKLEVTTNPSAPAENKASIVLENKSENDASVTVLAYFDPPVPEAEPEEPAEPEKELVEYGTWIPEVWLSDLSQAGNDWTAGGNYVKIGRMVYFNASVTETTASAREDGIHISHITTPHGNITSGMPAHIVTRYKSKGQNSTTEHVMYGMVLNQTNKINIGFTRSDETGRYFKIAGWYVLAE